MKHFLLLFFFCACALAQSQPRPASGGGGGVVNGQQLKDNDGNVFLDAGAQSIQAPKLRGFVEFQDDTGVTGNAYIDGNSGGLSLISVANTATTWSINEDGSASFANGATTIDSYGGVHVTSGMTVSGEISLGSNAILLSDDGSASFAGGGILFDSDGTTELANGLSTFFIDGTVRLNGIPTGDPHDVGQLYQDADTHAVYVSQGP